MQHKSYSDPSSGAQESSTFNPLFAVRRLLLASRENRCFVLTFHLLESVSKMLGGLRVTHMGEGTVSFCDIRNGRFSLRLYFRAHTCRSKTMDFRRLLRGLDALTRHFDQSAFYLLTRKSQCMR